MPFITQERRKLIAKNKLKKDEFEPGDRCFIAYNCLVYEWKANPRWATVDRLYQTVLEHNFTREDAAAWQLAWQVFFQLHVMPYEQKKRKENGDI